MVNIIQHDTRNVTSAAVILLGIIALAFTLLTIYVITSITHNFYVAGYYTISALFDAVGVDESSILGSAVPAFSGAFYSIVGLSIIDGIIKIVIVGFVIAALIDMVTSFGIRERISLITKRRLKDHVVICGYSFLGDLVAAKLKERKIPFVVIDRNPTKVDTLIEIGYPLLNEDFETEQALEDASVSKARAVLFLAKNDYNNLLGVITAKHLNTDARIIARANDENAITKMHRAGAELCIVPEVLAGLEMGDAIVTGRVAK